MKTVTSTSTKKRKCSRCGQLKHVQDLNGYDPITDDDSHAYCQWLFECDSDEARQMIDGLAEDLSEKK